MLHLTRCSRGLVAVALIVAVITSSQSAALAVEEPIRPLDTHPAPPPLLAPFACGTEWEGTTYGGHGSGNISLDLNQADDSSAPDLGQPILAQADGVVVWFKTHGWNKRAGTYIEIDYGDVTARYMHLIEGSIPEELAEVGALVESGDLLGLLGATGRVSGPHLHMEHWDSADYDDTAWYQLPRSNQLPVVFEGVEMIATLGRPSPLAISTNCPDPIEEPRSASDWRQRYSAYLVPSVS